MNKMLAAIEEVGKASGMGLNKAKCEIMRFGGRARVTFKNKTPVREVNKAKYLGCTLTKDNDVTAEVRGRIRDAMITLKKMHIYWRHSNCNLKHKLMVVQATLFSKVLFGLESAELTVGALRSLDIFHLKCLRKILKMKTTFVNRANTNEAVYKKANDQLKAKDQIRKLSNIYLERKQRFFCQVATAAPSDPLRRATFQGITHMPAIHRPRRRGRPKVKWAHTEAKKLWDTTQIGTQPRVTYNPRSDTQAATIHELAKQKLATKRN